MTRSDDYGGIDRFRIIAAFLIVGIHTYPLSDINEFLNFGVVNIFARIAVPFFLMVTGYFILPRFIWEGNAKFPTNFVKKTGLIYAGATLLYFPVSIYAGHYSSGNIISVFAKNLLFDGTFYHLWYLPALIIGVALIYTLSCKMPFSALCGLSVALYIFGLLGDSYYGFTMGVPFLKTVYDAGFNVFSYTRNGLFYAPVFLVMGAAARKKEKRMKTQTSIICFIVSTVLMLAEGFTLRNFAFQRHDSMYISLLPSMYFLFQILLSQRGKSSLFIRCVSLWVYILHPLFIIIIRGAVKLIGLTDLLVENSVIHCFAVCLTSFTTAAIITAVYERIKKKPFKQGRAWIEINMNNLRHNVRILQKALPNNCSLMPVVKANAYGHGAVHVCKELNQIGIYCFCVASVMEGVELRKNRIKGDILILGYTHPKDIYLLKRYRLTQTIINLEYAVLLNGFGKRLNVHIKVDTGMRRLGERSEDIYNILQIFNYRNLSITGIYTHLCTADSDENKDKAFTRTQEERFNRVLSSVKENGLKLPKTHIHSSYGVFINKNECLHDYVRVGIALYGVLSNRGDEEKHNADLSPVLSVKARVSMVKMLFKGESAGYGLDFTAENDMQIAVLTIGYADGIPRSLSSGAGQVIIGNHKVPIIGRICMDSMLVDVTGAEGVCIGETAVVIGKGDDVEINACDVAEQTETISNEILSRLGTRLERVVV